MSQRDQHPTIEQLSTWLDQQPRQARGREQAPSLRQYMTPEEQVFCSTHLEDCEQCQSVLDNLQQTVNLLRSLPQLEVPRSFALPADVQIASDRNKQVEQSIAVSPRRLPTSLRRTLRAVSALAAVIGLFITLSSFIAPLQPHPVATSASSMSAPSTANVSPSAQQRAVPQAAGANTSTPTNTDNKTGSTPTANANASNKAAKTQQGTETNATATEPILPFAFNQSEDPLFIGISLTILGCMGFVLFAQRRKHRTRLSKRN